MSINTDLTPALNSLTEYLKDNLTTVSNGVINPESIFFQGSTTARHLPTVFLFHASERVSMFLGGATLDYPLIDIIITAETDEVRDEIKDDVKRTLETGLNDIQYIGTLIVEGMRNDNAAISEIDNIRTLIQSQATVSVRLLI